MPVGYNKSINVPLDRKMNQDGDRNITKTKLQMPEFPKNLGGGYNKSSGTRNSDIKTTPSSYKDWSGK